MQRDHNTEIQPSTVDGLAAERPPVLTLGVTTRERAEDALVRLESWLIQNGWAGWDPFDAKGHPFYREMLRWKSIPARIVRRPFFDAELLLPSLVREVLGVRPEVNAKGMGLLVQGHVARFHATHDDAELEKALNVVQWLVENPSRGYSGLSWGYPFDWQSQIPIPRGTPSSVVTSTVGNGLWDLYKTTGEERYLDLCMRVADFFVTDLNIDEVDDDRLCFSYTPLDRFHCHNASLFVADFLGRVGRETNTESLVGLAARATRYTVGDQRPDGSFGYWGPEQNISNNVVDHFHTGFVLRSLSSLARTLGSDDVRAAVARGFQFYCASLFREDGAPVLFAHEPQSAVNIHSCAEAILCCTELAEEYGQSPRLSQSLEWTLSNMQGEDGHFYFERKRRYGRTWTITFPYLRWGQAWMFVALSRLLATPATGETGQPGANGREGDQTWY